MLLERLAGNKHTWTLANHRSPDPSLELLTLSLE